jgi:hypothetical protein
MQAARRNLQPEQREDLADLAYRQPEILIKPGRDRARPRAELRARSASLV